jgi:hypothetical protein
MGSTLAHPRALEFVIRTIDEILASLAADPFRNAAIRHLESRIAADRSRLLLGENRRPSNPEARSAVLSAMADPTMTFVARGRDDPAIEVRVNFGVYAGRAATPAEIDRLAEWLLDEVEAVSIVAEERHEIDARGEAVVHQVRVEVADGGRELEQRLVERADHWARLCAADRHAEIADGV